MIIHLFAGNLMGLMVFRKQMFIFCLFVLVGMFHGDLYVTVYYEWLQDLGLILSVALM